MLPIEEFSRCLVSIPKEEFTHRNILDFLRANQVDPATLSPYTYFSSDHYTRNLIRKTEMFELIAICWDIGQKSPIHNHRDQKCWMAVAYGKLHIHNFSVVAKDPARGFCELKSSTQFILAPDSPCEVDPAEPIHQVLNLPSFACRAVSLHIYSRPFDSCEVYDLKEKRYQDMPLVNTTEYGVLKTDMIVEKVSLI